MHAAPSERRRVRALSAVLVPTLAGWNNLLAPRLSAAAYTGANAAAAGAILAAARAAGLSWPELGLDRRRLRSGVRAGAACGLPLAAGYAVALALPAVRPVLADARVAGLGGRRLAADVLVRIPVGTVLWEEVAFRGVLQGALDRLFGAHVAGAAGAVLFGVWHVAPTMAAVRANAPAATASRRRRAVLVGCTGTAAAGLLFTVLRQRSGSLLAPALLHLAANSLGLLAAAGAHRLHGRTSAAVATTEAVVVDDLMSERRASCCASAPLPGGRWRSAAPTRRPSPAPSVDPVALCIRPRARCRRARQED